MVAEEEADEASNPTDPIARFFEERESEGAFRARILTKVAARLEAHREAIEAHDLGTRLQELTESVRALRAEPDWDPAAIRAERALARIASEEALGELRGELATIFAEKPAVTGPSRVSWSAAFFLICVGLAAPAIVLAWTRDVYGPSVREGFSGLTDLTNLVLGVLSAIGVGAAVFGPVRDALEKASKSVPVRVVAGVAMVVFGAVNAWAASRRTELDIRCEPGATFGDTARLSTANVEVVACGARFWVDDAEPVTIRAPLHTPLRASAVELQAQLEGADGLLALEKLERLTADLRPPAVSWAADAAISVWCDSRQGLRPIAHYEYSIIVSSAYQRADGDTVSVIEPSAVRAAATLRAIIVRGEEHRCSLETKQSAETLMLRADGVCFPADREVLVDIYACAPASLGEHERPLGGPRVQYGMGSNG